LTKVVINSKKKEKGFIPATSKARRSELA